MSPVGNLHGDRRINDRTVQAPLHEELLLVDAACIGSDLLEARARLTAGAVDEEPATRL